MLIINKLEEIAQRLENTEEINISIINNLISEANKYEESWSGSIFGYHSNVYYRDFQKPPVGCFFNQEWGLQREYYLKQLGFDSVGDWVEYERGSIQNRILDSVDEDKINVIIGISNELRVLLSECKDSVLSIIHSQNIVSKDPYLGRLVAELEKFKVFEQKDYEKSFLKRFSGKQYTRDKRLTSGNVYFNLPEHQKIICKATGILSAFCQKNDLIKIIRKIQEHIENIKLIMVDKEMIKDFNKLNNREATVYNIGSIQNMANHNSGDYLQQSVSYQSLSVFDEVKNKLKESNEDKEIIRDLISIIEEMDKNKNTDKYKTLYGTFIENAAKSVSLLNSIVEFIPKLGDYLS